MFNLRRPQKLDMYGLPCRALPNTQFLVDAFPRCGNTFFYYLLRETQESDLRIAHHMHSAGHLAMGVRFGVPTMTIVRKPDAACLSHIIRVPNVSAQASLESYLRFHTVLLKLSNVLIVTFEEVIKEPDSTLKLISQIYPVIKYVKVDKMVLENVDMRVKKADMHDRQARNDQRDESFTVAKPSPAREKIKEQRKEEIYSQGRLLIRCNEVYNQLIAKLERSQSFSFTP